MYCKRFSMEKWTEETNRALSYLTPPNFTKKFVKYPPNLKHDSLLFQATSEYRIMSGKPKFQFYRFLSIRNAQEMSIHDNLNLDFRNI